MADYGRDERTSFGGLAKSDKKYGSTSNHMKRNEVYVKHYVSPSDTLQGIALRYGVTTEQIRRVNRIWTNDSLFLKPTLDIPVAKDSVETFSLDNGDSVPSSPAHSRSLSGDDLTHSSLSEASTPALNTDCMDGELIGDRSEQTVADLLVRIDSTIAQTKHKVEKMDQNSGILEDDDDPYSLQRRLHSSRMQSIMRASSDPNVAPHPLVMTQGRKVRSSLQRLEREQDEMFEL